MADLIMQSPLNGQKHSADGLTVMECEPCSKINLRGDIADIASVLKDVSGIADSPGANTYLKSGEQTLFWLGPDELLHHSADKDVDVLVRKLREKLPAADSAIVDVSDYYTVIRVAGQNARAVLSSGTPFDVHPRVFKPGDCAQTRFGNATVLLSCWPDNAFDLQVRWSFAEYLWKYLCRVGSYV